MNIDCEQWRQTVIEGAWALGVKVSADQARAMGRHALELLQWNRITNLTAITGAQEMALKHYVDSAAATAWIGEGVRVLDAGSGGGFPGIPLNILRPDLPLTMVDSVHKKVSFLKHAIRTLGLRRINAVHGRLEELSRLPAFRNRFDLVVCRAFSSLETFAVLALPFLSPGGALLAMKGPQADHDHETINLQDDGTIMFNNICFAIHIHRYRIPLLDAQRSLVRLTPLPEG